MNVTDGYIYCLTNRSMPGKIRCGTTTKDIIMQINEINLECSMNGLQVPYTIEFAKYVHNVTKVGYNLFAVLSMYSGRTSMPNVFDDALERVKVIFDCFEGNDWNNANAFSMNQSGYQGASYAYDPNKSQPTYGSGGFDPFGPISGGPQSQRQYTPPGSYVSPPSSMQYPPPTSLPMPFIGAQQPQQHPMQFQQQPQQQQPVVMQNAAVQQIAVPQHMMMVSPNQQPAVIVNVSQPVASVPPVEPSYQADRQFDEEKEEIKAKKNNTVDKKKTELSTESGNETITKGVKGGKRLDLYFSDGQAVRHLIAKQTPKTGIYMSEYKAIVCGNIHYISLKAFAEDHKDEVGVDNKTHNAWSECELMYKNKWRKTNNIPEIPFAQILYTCPMCKRELCMKPNELVKHSTSCFAENPSKTSQFEKSTNMINKAIAAKKEELANYDEIMNG